MLEELERLANNAPPPKSATLEKQASLVKTDEDKKKRKGNGLKLKELAATVARIKEKCKAKGKPNPVQGKHGGSKSQGHQNKDEAIGPPFRLSYKWKPIHEAQAILTGTVAGEKGRFITKIAVSTRHDFSTIMQQLHVEANTGAFVTKAQAIQRRDELIGKRQAETANVLPGAAADGWDVD